MHLVLAQAQIPFACVICNRHFNDAVGRGAVAGGNVAAQVSGLSAHARICELQTRHQAVSGRLLTFGHQYPELQNYV